MASARFTRPDGPSPPRRPLSKIRQPMTRQIADRQSHSKSHNLSPFLKSAEENTWSKYACACEECRLAARYSGPSSKAAKQPGNQAVMQPGIQTATQPGIQAGSLPARQMALWSSGAKASSQPQWQCPGLV